MLRGVPNCEKGKLTCPNPISASWVHFHICPVGRPLGSDDGSDKNSRSLRLYSLLLATKEVSRALWKSHEYEIFHFLWSLLKTTDSDTVTLNGETAIKIFRDNKPRIWGTNSHGGIYGSGYLNTT